MEKEPTLIEQKLEDAVKNFRKEMEKEKNQCNTFYVNYRYFSRLNDHFNFL